MIDHHLTLCLVTNANDAPLSEYHRLILQAVAGGVTMIQLREKSRSPEQLREMALQLKTLLEPVKVPLIINDHVALAVAVDADGVHLGQSDGSAEEARQQLGSGKIIGISVESFEDLERANQLSCIDYIAASAVFNSTTKTDCKTIWGLEGLREVVLRSRHPVMAIGGINPLNLAAVLDQGAAGVAVINAIHAHRNPAMAAQEMMSIIQKMKRGGSCG